jgi:branched-chain amino acid transport system ATP-binding protein
LSAARPLLAVHGLVKRFGGVTAVAEVSFGVPEGSITGLIGPNGAGKSTVLGLVSGFVPPSAGRVDLAGADVTGWTRTAWPGAACSARSRSPASSAA